MKTSSCFGGLKHLRMGPGPPLHYFRFILAQSWGGVRTALLLRLRICWRWNLIKRFTVYLDARIREVSGPKRLRESLGWLKRSIDSLILKERDLDGATDKEIPLLSLIQGGVNYRSITVASRCVVENSTEYIYIYILLYGLLRKDPSFALKTGFRTKQPLKKLKTRKGLSFKICILYNLAGALSVSQPR